MTVFEGEDENVPYVRSIKTLDDAEDVKYVLFEGDSKSVSVGITDEVMVEFVDVAEHVFEWIHTDMAEMHDLIASAREDPEAWQYGADTHEPLYSGITYRYSGECPVCGGSYSEVSGQGMHGETVDTSNWESVCYGDPPEGHDGNGAEWMYVHTPSNPEGGD